MKNLLPFMFILISFAGISQTDLKAQFSLYALTDVPFKSEMPKMSPNFGVGAQFAYKPMAYIPLFLELKGNLGIYNTQNRDVTYLFTDGSATETNVQFTSSMHKLQFGTKLYYTSFYRPVRAYVTPQVGYSFMNSRMRIADPNDFDDCQPLENEITHRGRAWTYGGELGVEFDMNRIFKGEDKPEQRLVISASYLSSMRPAEYINIKYMQEDVHPVAGEHDHTAVDSDGRPLNAEFVNLTSGTTHEHKIAEVYKSYLRFVTVNVGYVWYF